MHSIYVPCHNHTRRGSNFDGDIDIKKFVAYCKGLGIPAACITDHGSMAAGFELFEECQKAGLKHLIGIELYVKEPDGEKTPKGKDYYHLTAIAVNLEGYKNLCKLSTIGNIEQIHGKSKKPCVTNDQIFAHSEGVVILSGCISSELNQSLDVGDEQRAKKWILKFRSVFRDRLYLEMHCHSGLRKSWPNNSKKIVELGKKLGVKRIITNDAHFLKQEDWFSQTLTLAIGMKGNATLGSERLNNFEYTGEEYIKTREEIFEHFLEHSGLDEKEINAALDSTLEISDRFENYSLKNCVRPIEFCENAKELFKLKCFEGMERRYPGISPEDDRWTRLTHEIKVISDSGFADYFLIVEDFCSYVRSVGHKVGKGRGSAAGSLVAYVLGITDIDPIKHGLIFERFLNAGRVSMPDIDTDIDGEGKDLVIQHLREKWGRYNVASVGTITKSAAGSSLADSFRVHDLPYRRSIEISKKYFKTVRGVPPKISTLLEDKNSDFYKFFSSDQCTDEERVAIERAASLIEGRERQAGVHAGGVAISSELFDLVPLVWDGGEEKITTVYDKDELEKMGVIKFDILGLTNLAQELEVERLLKEVGIKPPEYIDELGYYPEIYEALRGGDTFGVFQLSEGIPTKLLKEIETKCFEDLSAVNALNRPGPLDSGSDRIYVHNRKNGTPKIHPIVDRLLSETYGIMLYQEEIMFMAQELAGYSLAEADDLRKIIGKKQVSKMPAQEEKFVGGAIARGVSESLAKSLWAEVKAAGEYSFNKSHTYAYGYQALISAYYKAYFPAQFWAAGITVNNTKFEKSAEYIAQTRRRFKVVTPFFACPRAKSWVEGEVIVVGLGNLKGIGINAAIEVESNAPYSNILDFCLRSGLDFSIIAKLNKLGFFGRTYDYNGFEEFLKKIKAHRTREATRATKRKEPMPPISEESVRAYLAEKEFIFPQPIERTADKIAEIERELIGVVISVNVLEGLEEFSSYLQEQNPGVIVGMPAGMKYITTKRGNQMAFLAIEGRDGEVKEVTVFSEQLVLLNELIQRSMTEFRPLALFIDKGEYNGRDSYTLRQAVDLRDAKSFTYALAPYSELLNLYRLNENIVAGIIVENRPMLTPRGETENHLVIQDIRGKLTDVYLRPTAKGRDNLETVLPYEDGVVLAIRTPLWSEEEEEVNSSILDAGNPVVIRVSWRSQWGKRVADGWEIDLLDCIHPQEVGSFKNLAPSVKPGIIPVTVCGAAAPIEFWV